MHLSRLSYFGDFVLSPIVAAALFVMPLLGRSSSAYGQWLLAAAAGVVAWTFAEYLIHRFIYHRVEPLQSYHDAHHDDPKALIGAPSFIGFLLIFAIVFAPLLPFGPVVACGVTSGFVMGYFAYMMIHHASHHWNIRPGSYLYGLRQHHARHHYAHELGNFGVSTAIWDHVFGTVLEGRRRTANR